MKYLQNFKISNLFELINCNDLLQQTDIESVFKRHLVVAPKHQHWNGEMEIGSTIRKSYLDQSSEATNIDSLLIVRN